MTVFGNAQNEEASIRLYDGDRDEVIVTDSAFAFRNDLVLGTPSQPYGIVVTGGLDVPKKR